MDLWGSEDESSEEGGGSAGPSKYRASDPSDAMGRLMSRDSITGGEGKHKENLAHYASRSRSSSNSKAGSISPSRSRSRSRRVSLSRSRSVSRSRSLSSPGALSRSVSRSRSPPVHPTIQDEESDEEYESSNNKKAQSTGLGLDISESEEENEDVGSTANKASRISREHQKENEESSDDERPTINNDYEVVSTSKKASAVARQQQRNNEDSSDDEGPRRNDDDDDTVARGGNDFDNMLQRKRELNRQNSFRRKRDIDVINNNDDAIAQMLADMRIAAQEDRDLNNAGQPATKKMAIFKRVMANLGKLELQMAFVEANLLSVMTDWLAPMPDKSLPHVFIRSQLLTLLAELKLDDPSRLKESGIGKAVMYLYRHPKETRDNKSLAGQIINEWARPIFHKETDFAKLSKEDRRENDDLRAKRAFQAQGGKRRRMDESEEPNLKPGDPGWVGRARVPMPDNSEYIKRPEWQNHIEIVDKVAKKGITLLEKHKRKFAERKRIGKNLSMTKISIEGARMGL